MPFFYVFSVRFREAALRAIQRDALKSRETDVLFVPYVIIVTSLAPFLINTLLPDDVCALRASL